MVFLFYALGVTSEKEMMELVGYVLDDPLKRYAKHN